MLCAVDHIKTSNEREEKTMKNKTIFLLLASLMIYMFSACSVGPTGAGVVKSSAKDITAFSIGDRVGAISGTDITVTMPYGTTDVTGLTPTITVSAGASVSPASGVAQDFTSPITYTVTAADGSTKAYKVTVTVAASGDKNITAFSILGRAGIITGTNIAVTVPFGTIVTTLTPTIAITGDSVSPASGVAHDFTSPSIYTVTAADGTTKAYTVTVTVALAYTVTYDNNGGAGTLTDPNSPYENGDTVTVLANTGFAYAGGTFVGWNTAADGSGTHYGVAATFTMATAPVILFAQWTIDPTYTVTYDANGGMGALTDPNSPYLDTDTVTVLDNTFTYLGQTFVNWCSDTIGTAPCYDATDTFDIAAADVTLYAQWTPSPTYNVLYDANGGIGALTDPSSPYLDGAMVIALTNTFTYSGYKFVNWCSDAIGTAPCYNVADSFTIATADVTLYAQWMLLDLGTASTFGLMATFAINNTGFSIINGDTALAKTAASMTGFPDGVVNGSQYFIGDPETTLAEADLFNAYSTAKAALPVTATVGTADLGGLNPGGLGVGIFPPGIYFSGSTMAVNTPLTLDGQGDDNAVWIFQIGSSLTTTSPVGNVMLQNHAQAKNVFWVSTNATTIGDHTVFNGTIISGDSVTCNTGATINGGILAGAITDGTITLNNCIVNVTSVYGLRDIGLAGGLIFYDKGFYSNGWKYLEAAPSDIMSGLSPEFIAWSNITNTLVGTDTAIGTGQANTTAIIAQLGHTGSAAKSCGDLVVGAYSDWFLPSQGELAQMYTELKAHGVGDLASNLYWSSSEYALNNPAGNAWDQNFSAGDLSANAKDAATFVRCVRAF